ncbi:MAG: glycosyltransferase [Boseongicola sp.]|nr:glycosyltransferase [Boseongicola sp.]MDD9977066.1 glycosyltransferase [Boseongicola sp.]
MPPKAEASSSFPLRLPLGDARLLDQLAPDYALQHGVLPLQRVGALSLVATPDQHVLERERASLERVFGPIAGVSLPRKAIQFGITHMRGQQLANRAAKKTEASESCRNWSSRRATAFTLGFLTIFVAASFMWPTTVLTLVTIWAVLTLVSVTGIRTVGAFLQLRQTRRAFKTWRTTRLRYVSDTNLPAISLLVPLFKETEIASRLVRRLSNLRYPSEKLDILLIVEAGDSQTEKALQQSSLSDSFRVVRVPEGAIKTKPRALNYALDFANGEIIGVYDAEDAPDPEQLRKVANAFADAPENVACLQGILDFYNSRQNLLTRCFTIDYASWFRLILPGLVRLGIAIPLGGTTVFFRRSVLDKIGAWDAHNVTEDADLGIRLARRGYRTEFIQSVTLEEATASVPAWLKQRSRWIKGYAITWAVHMRNPLKLWRDLGTKRFLGFQALFLGSLSQFVLAPLMWSFWLVLFGLPHPISGAVSQSVIVAVGILFLLTEIATIFVAAVAVATPRHRGLIWFTPLMHLYWPLASFASLKGLGELFWRPFFWDKTAHGHFTSPEELPRPSWHQRLAAIVLRRRERYAP